MTEPMDQAARTRILEDLNTTLLVEAGAGSGKTTSLVGRLLALVATGTADIDKLAAITFTNKAADEMKERLRIALERSASRAQGERKARLEEALAKLDQCFIGTIHSFCSSLLRERPIEAGVDPSFEEMDDESNRLFHDRCWDEYLIRLQESGDRTLQSFEALHIDLRTLKEVYDRISLFTDVHIPCEPAPRPDFDLIRLSLLPLIDDARLYMPQTEPERGWDKLQGKLKSAGQMLELYDMRDDMQLLKLAGLFDAKLDVTQNRWTDKAQAKAIGTAFHDWQITVLFPFLQAWREYLYPQVIRFVLPVLDYCRLRRQEAGKLNFQDLLVKACELLREHPEARRYYAGRYERLMVDEFQDTDPVQAEMMFLLTGEGDDPEERNWRKLTPRPGSLFVVGDPKQSIYRFRRADISIYNEVKSRIAACGDVLLLTSNFRSVDALGAFVNGQFVGKLPSRETEQQAAYVKMITATPDPKRKKRAYHGVYGLSYPKIAGGKDEVAKADARRIAAYIAWACRDGNLLIQERVREEWAFRDARPSDFLILTRTRHSLHVYAEELERCGVAAETFGSSVIYPELVALQGLVAFLADPTDRIALLGVLRGPLFGISDTALMAYRALGRGWSIYRLPEAAACWDGAQTVLAAMTMLGHYASLVRELPAWSALYRLMEETGMAPYAFLQEAGANRAGTLLKLQSLLQQSAATAYDWHALSKALTDICRLNGMETASLHAGKGQAVRVMNVHKAKGLEAPVVFLANPSGERDHDADQVILRSEEEASGYFLIQQLRGYQKETIAQPVGWEALRAREREFMNAERDRLLYVAATRAKQMLVVSLYPEQPAKCPWSELMEGMAFIRELDDDLVLEEGTERQGESGGTGAGTVAGSGTGAIAETGHEAVVGAARRAGAAKAGAEPFPDRALFLDAQAQALENMSRPTYREASVTELAKSAAQKPEWSAEGKGLAFGSVIHYGLEALGRGLDERELGDYVNYLCMREGVADIHLADAIAMLRAALSSELWRRSQAAKQRLFEVPLMLMRTVREGDAEELPLLVKGVVDLAFEEEDGWLIADFKTDLFDTGKLPQFVRFYAPQVQAYADAWSDVFGYKVKESGLYFASVGVYVTV